MEEIILFLQNFLGDTWGVILAGISMLIALANFITMLLPSVKENAIYDFIMKILNFLSLNVLKNKNADDKQN